MKQAFQSPSGILLALILAIAFIGPLLPLADPLAM
ncbi:nickel ABC transporter permease subunit NikC, partial [Paracoccus versutus]